MLKLYFLNDDCILGRKTLTKDQEWIGKVLKQLVENLTVDAVAWQQVSSMTDGVTERFTLFQEKVWKGSALGKTELENSPTI